MDGSQVVRARLFGALRTWALERGKPATLEVAVPSGGMMARDMARQAGLPLDLIEGVFVDGRVYGADRVIFPGQRVAFVPKGTPGPHRVFLGLYDAGKRESWT
ncbi:MoaD/ThiS family protein [Coriobacteriia bacterium Es71-Z0120]|uniref:MoaD/ThiS family protein n=1 Tax=Parvivirga hydrogeniphila TaxID=2939460 RepID=UPI002260DF3F|nr:MoaD/ThiS family protein [Parvivirga hydrogeniphila]MCL4078315.1 MoaD/ThiS family protein [Parvivirga hydrogeniphila]